MDISSVLSAVIKRWYVSLVVLALTGFAAQQLWQSAQPQYTASTTMTVVPTPSLMQVREESDAGQSSLGNPFGVSATTVLSGLLIESINSGEISIPEQAGATQLAVELSSQNVQSFFNLVAVSSTPQGPNIALEAAETQSIDILASIQTTAGAPNDQLYTAQRTRFDEPVITSFPDRQRMVLGVVLAGLLVAALLSVVLDASLRTRSRRSRAKAAQRTTVVVARPDAAARFDDLLAIGDTSNRDASPTGSRRASERRSSARSLTPVPDTETEPGSPRRTRAAGR